MPSSSRDWSACFKEPPKLRESIFEVDSNRLESKPSWRSTGSIHRRVNNCAVHKELSFYCLHMEATSSARQLVEVLPIFLRLNQRIR